MTISNTPLCACTPCSRHNCVPVSRNTGLHLAASVATIAHQTALISIRSITEFGVYRTRIRDVGHLKEQRLIEEWQRFGQKIINRAIKQWRRRLRSVSLKEEDTLNINCSLDTQGIDS